MPGRTRSPSTDAPSVSPPTPAQGPSGQSNSDAVADAGLAAPISENSLEGLEAAVDSGLAGQARIIAASLPPDDLAGLKANGNLTERTLALIGAGPAADLLYRLQHPHDLWLQLADIHCAGNVAALQRVLTDVGIDNASDIAAHIGDFSGLTNIKTAAVMGAMITTSVAEDQAALISTNEGTGLFVDLYSDPALDVLTALAASSTAVLDLYVGNEPARMLIGCHPGVLDDLVLDTWVTPGEWLRGLAPAQAASLTTLFDTDPGRWGIALHGLLIAGNAEDASVLPFGGELANRVIGLIATGVDPIAAADVCAALGYAPADTIVYFGDCGWLTTETALALQAGATAGELGAVCGTSAAIDHLAAIGHPADLLPYLAELQAFPGIYAVSESFRTWMDMDMVRFEAMAKANSAPWVAAFIRAGAVQPLLDFAVSEPATWRAVVTDPQFQAILGTLPKPCGEVAVDGIWALWTDAARTVDSGYALYHTVFGIRMWSGSVNPTFANETDAVIGGVTYERRMRFDLVDPDQTAMNTYLARLQLLPRGQVSAASVGFGNRLVMDAKRKSPAPVDADWNASIGPGVVRSYTTSMYFPATNFILMAATSTGAIPNGLGPGSSQAAVDGHSDGAGGARDLLDDDGNSITAPTTDQALSWFENHAQHEVGHGVGEQKYAGMARSGDDQAKKYARWRNSSQNSMMNTYFGGAPASVNDVQDATGANKSLSRLELGTYLMSIVRTGNEPGPSTAPGNAGRVVSRLPGMNRQQRIDAILASAAGIQDLVHHVDAIINNSQTLPGGAYDYSNFEPTGSTVHIWCDAEGGFRKYDKAAKDNIVPLMGWYSMSSHSEMFAEIYTQYYSTAAHDAPSPVNGVNWTEFFTALEASPDSQLEAGVAPEVSGFGAAPGSQADVQPFAPGGGGNPGGNAGGGAVVVSDLTEGVSVDAQPI